MTADQTTHAPATASEPIAPQPAAPGRRPGRLARLRSRAEAGMSTAEYAVGTVAACAFAAVLYRVVSGDSIVDGLTDLVEAALATLS
ncbi:DUF4244 domain-containing protein [Blastococcus sp. KM273128]|uniref:DUF4244 domain-containing protein n=1 Tax=Blastococcus sp. KM273128 TaxID=2570314 RepID=UPI001F1F5D00|nr:DUF4244 domain-containing protein [Blastococcus sp. KM273128]MCF6744110.1 DUF4244 domain-containing protein [Blastococcus sp. KM273128]